MHGNNKCKYLLYVLKLLIFDISTEKIFETKNLKIRNVLLGSGYNLPRGNRQNLFYGGWRPPACTGTD